MTKQTITVLLEHISPYSIEGKLSDVRDRIDEWIAEYGPNAALTFRKDFYYDYEHDPTPTYFLRRSRPETDEEYEVRRAQEGARSPNRGRRTSAVPRTKQEVR